MSDDAADFVRWRAPSVAGGDAGDPARPSTNVQREAELQEAHQEAYARGLEEGRAAGEAELATLVAGLDRLLSELAEPFAELDEEVETELVNLAVNVARQIIRRELRVDPSHIVGVVRDAMRVLPIAARDVRVHLHPEDASVVRRALQREGDDLPWQIVEDPMLTRGGARVTTATAQIDARIESRLSAILLALVEGDREGDAGA